MEAKWADVFGVSHFIILAYVKQWTIMERKAMTKRENLFERLRIIDEKAENLLRKIDERQATMIRINTNDKEMGKAFEKQLQELTQRDLEELKKLKTMRLKICEQLGVLIVDPVNKSFQDKPRIIRAAENLLFDECQAVTNEMNFKEAVKYVIEEILELTPAEYDAIYSNRFNQMAHIDYAVRKIVEGASDDINRKTAFVSKQVLFATLWPNYYKLHYFPVRPMDVFNATGEIKSALIRNGKPREDDRPGRRDRIAHRADEVDAIVYWAMNEVFKSIEMPIKDLFLSLADPKKFGWRKLGFVRVIEARGCYPSPLDFYFMNSPLSFQKNHFQEYMDARKEAGLNTFKLLEKTLKVYETIHLEDGLEEKTEDEKDER